MLHACHTNNFVLLVENLKDINFVKTMYLCSHACIGRFKIACM